MTKKKPQVMAQNRKHRSRKITETKIGQTFFTNDRYLEHTDNNAYKDVNVVAIETDKKGNMIVVRLSKQRTQNTAPLKHHTYRGFKRFVEIQDIDGEPIHRNERFKQNSEDYDLTKNQVKYIEDVAYNHSKQSQTNKQKREKFRRGEFGIKKSKN